MGDVTLLPCPFCGAGPLCHYDGTAWHIRCNSAVCGIRPHTSMWNKDDAVAAWNRRALTPAQQAAEEIEKALREAAESLNTIATQAGKDEYMTDIYDVRGYANSRARVARAALAKAGKP